MRTGTASIARLKTATAEAIFWEAIEAFAIRARTMSPTLQNARAQQNAALAHSSRIGNVRTGPKETRAVALHMSAFEPKQTSGKLYKKDVFQLTRVL